MKTAVCHKCGFRLRVHRKVPKACPLCGYDKSGKEEPKSKEKN